MLNNFWSWAFQAEVAMSLLGSLRFSVWPSVCPSFRKLQIIRTITHKFRLKSPNLHTNAYWDIPSCYWKWGHWPWPSRSFWSFRLQILVNLACPRNNYNGYKLASPNMHLGILLPGTENGGLWPLPSRSFGHFVSEFIRKCVQRFSGLLIEAGQWVLHVPTCSCSVYSHSLLVSFKQT